MTNLENIIMDIKEVNCTHDFWIRNSDGEIKDDIICADIIPFLEELKAYEIDISQDAVMTLREGLYDKLEFCNTYNYGACLDHDFEFDYYISPTNGKFIVFIMVHRFGKDQSIPAWKTSICPTCGERIVPCSMCDNDNIDCNKCLLIKNDF